MYAFQDAQITRNLKNGQKKLFKEMASFDIKDAYYSVPFDESLKKNLKFYWKRELCQLFVLPNDLASQPRWFSKFLKPPLEELMKIKIDLSLHTGDIYLQETTQTEFVIDIQWILI